MMLCPGMGFDCYIQPARCSLIAVRGVLICSEVVGEDEFQRLADLSASSPSHQPSLCPELRMSDSGNDDSCAVRLHLGTLDIDGTSHPIAPLLLHLFYPLLTSFAHTVETAGMRNRLYLAGLVRGN